MDSKTNKAEEELTVRYGGQPWFCKICEVHHKGGCLVSTRERKEKKMRKEECKKTIRTKMIGTSNMQWMDEESLTSDVICISGAKIGHIDNQLTVADAANIDTIIMVACCNNVDGALMEKEQLEECEQQTAKELTEWKM